MKTLDPDYLAPKQFSKMATGSDDFACASVCVEFHFHLVHPYCLRLCLRLQLALLVKTRPSGSVVNAKSITLQHSNENHSSSSSVLYSRV